MFNKPGSIKYDFVNVCDVCGFLSADTVLVSTVDNHVVAICDDCVDEMKALIDERKGKS